MRLFLRRTMPSIAATLFFPIVASAASCPGYTQCPAVNYPGTMRRAPALAVQASIDATEATALQNAQQQGLSQSQLQAYLGQVLVFDRQLSYNGGEACALCHGPGTGFSGGIEAFTRGGGVFPGAETHRTGFRAPQSLAYSGFAPPLTYRPSTKDFAGGNFWDSRATGAITGSPAADQATMPFTNPFEMGLPDPACVVRRIAVSKYAAQFTQLWGASTLSIAWPANTDKVCATVNNGGDQAPLALSDADRTQATATLGDVGLTVASFETSSLASPFTSKYDAVQAGTASFTKLELEGSSLFNGVAHCNQCHTSTGSNTLFTSFTSFNIGVPRNPKLPYLTENAADGKGYIANPNGPAYVDDGLGAYLNTAAVTNKQWKAQASRFIGTFQVPTLRNVAAVPNEGYRRAYMHNGFFSDLKTVVHFYNTRDVLPVCTGNGDVIGKTCWPAAEEPQNENTALLGNLGLSNQAEEAIVAFLETLTDGYKK